MVKRKIPFLRPPKLQLRRIQLNLLLLFQEEERVFITEVGHKWEWSSYWYLLSRVSVNLRTSSVLAHTIYSESKVLCWSTSFCVAWLAKILLTIMRIELYVGDVVSPCYGILYKYCVSKFYGISWRWVSICTAHKSCCCSLYYGIIWSSCCKSSSCGSIWYRNEIKINPYCGK